VSDTNRGGEAAGATLESSAVPAPPPPAARGGGAPLERRRRTAYRVVARLVIGVVLLVAWEVGVRLWAPAYVARPTAVVPVLPEVIANEDFRAAFLGTMWAMVQGLVIAVAAAVLVGLAMGQIRWLQWSLRGYTYALFSLPMVAVVPLITMWFGYSETARLVVIVFAAYFPMALNVFDGARSVSRHYLEVAATYRAPRRAVWFGVVLPASVPYLLAGFRLASGRALVGAVVAEYIIGGIDGLGFYILLNARSFRHNEAMVAVLALALVGVGLLALAKWGTRRLAPWYHAQRAG
jgi:ABC-type nitrate/sulfonate/bicarbonate transport system permease component